MYVYRTRAGHELVVHLVRGSLPVFARADEASRLFGTPIGGVLGGEPARHTFVLLVSAPECDLMIAFSPSRPARCPS
ncbi:hypothetical protein DRB87_06290 [Pandoraea sp. XY-2]|nr:hypothetical protein DRB87_06290 [Pandoraea sp. XY-2]